jgi:two-component system NtrC family sensor kinase
MRAEPEVPITIRRAEAELSRRNAVLGAVTYAATRIVSAADWRPAMPELLERLGVATGVSRAFLFQIHPAPHGRGMSQSCKFIWTAPEIEPIDIARLQNMQFPEEPDSTLAEFLGRRFRGEVVQITVGQASGDIRRLLEEFETYSLLSVPIFVEGAYWGSLGFDDCVMERVWDEMEVDLLKTATALIAAGIERSRADERLKERDNLLVGAQRIAKMGSWVLDFDTDKVSWSEEGWRIFGLDSATPAWSHDDNLKRIHPDDRALVAEMDARAHELGEPFDIEYRIMRPNGEVRILRERADVVRDTAGRASRLVGIVHDITEMKQNEMRLKESEERYALAARGAGVGLFDWNVKSDEAYFSPRLHELMGAASGSLGRSIAGLFNRFLAPDQETLKRHLESRYRSKRSRFELEVRSRFAENDLRWFLIRGLIVYVGDDPARLVGSLSDITDRKRAFEEIVRQREVLYQNEKMTMLGTLLAGVAHELNNPLSVVIGQVAMLEQTAKEEAVLKRVERIQKATERCARIVRTFLAMARHRERQSTPVRVNELIETVLELMAFQLRSADVHMELDLAGDIPEMMADADQVHQLMTNLVLNARQALASSAQPRIIRIATRFDPRTDRLKLTVSDNGPGVPAELRQRIFDPFFTTKPAGEGTGIGLSLCSSIVRAHCGTIGVSDNPGGGAVFTIELPLEITGKSAALEPVRPHDAPQASHVLIIEDEPEIAEMLSEILRSRGHQTRLAADGREGLECAVSQNYDVILSDIRLPLLDGLDIYRALQRRRPNLLRRLAFITGDTLSADIQSFLSETGAPCLEKPFLPADVLGLISRLAPQPGLAK